MSKLVFEPSDFRFDCTMDEGRFGVIISPQQAAAQAQAKFDKWLEEQQVVYGATTVGRDCLIWEETEQQHFHTHKARVVCLEAVEKPECMHVPGGIGPTSYGHYCLKCGVEIQATGWVVK